MRRLLTGLLASALLWPTIALSAPGGPTGHRFDSKAAVDYGDLIHLPYEMNDFAVPPHEFTPPYTGLPPPYTGLPSKYNFTAWIRMNDFTPRGRIRPKFYGVIVQRQSDPNSFILVLRGTSGGIEWFDDFMAIFPVAIPGFAGKVGDGFGRIFGSMEVIGANGQPTDEFGHGFVNEVFAAASRKLAHRAARIGVEEQAAMRNRIKIEVTGHSLGSALATLYVAKNAHDRQLHISRVYTFASPLVGNSEFVDSYNALGIETWRIANFLDWVPHLPPDFSYHHVNEAQPISSWFEVHADPACWHSMLTYLHVLDRSIDIDAGCVPLQPEQQHLAGH